MPLEKIVDLLSESSSRALVLPPLQRMYFEFVATPFRFLRTSPDYRAARDLVRLQSHLQSNDSLREFRCKSNFFSNHAIYKSMQDRKSLADFDKATIQAELIDKHEYLIRAALIADLLNRETRKDRFRWVVTLLLSILSIALAVYLKKDA